MGSSRMALRASLLALALMMLILRARSLKSSADANAEDLYCMIRDPLMDPVYEVRYGRDVVWQIPSNPKAVLFMGHGMNKEPLGYFDSSPQCPQCYGLPEDRGVVLAALERNYAVILVKSAGPYWLPWNVLSFPIEETQDRILVPKIIEEWTRDYSLENLPLAAFGYSSGGNFSSLLTIDLDIRSLVLMCSPGELIVLEHADSSVFPPTLFVPMPQDNSTYGFYTLAQQAKESLISKGVKVGEFDVWPTAIYPLFFTERIPCLGVEVSERIFAAYKAESWLDDNNFLTKNPRLEDWESVLWKWNALPFCKSRNDLCLAQHVQQELMMAFAEHSLTSSANHVVYDWLDTTLFGSTFDLPGSTASL